MDPRSDHIRLLRLLLLREAVTSLVVWLSRLWHCPKWKWFNFTAFTTHYCFFCGPVRCRWWTKSFSPREAMRGCPRVSQFQLLAFMDFPHCPGRSGCRLSVVFLCSTFETISYALGWTEKKHFFFFVPVCTSADDLSCAGLSLSSDCRWLSSALRSSLENAKRKTKLLQ